MLNTLFTSLALLFIVAMIFQILTIQSFFSHLESVHKKLYEEMGRPKWRIQLADDAFQRGLKYIRSKQFRELEDEDLEKIYKRVKRTDYVAIGSALVALGITIFQAIKLS